MILNLYFLCYIRYFLGILWMIDDPRSTIDDRRRWYQDVCTLYTVHCTLYEVHFIQCMYYVCVSYIVHCTCMTMGIWNILSMNAILYLVHLASSRFFPAPLSFPHQTLDMRHTFFFYLLLLQLYFIHPIFHFATSSQEFFLLHKTLNSTLKQKPKLTYLESRVQNLEF